VSSDLSIGSALHAQGPGELIAKGGRAGFSLCP
jgi:hypothetical protein